MRKPISIGVVGIGFGRQVHVPAFRSDPRCVVAGIAARRFERAQEVAQILGISHVYRDGREMADDPEIAAIAIAAPPGVQAAVGLDAVRAGKHLFCEKPLALNATEAQAIVDAARANKVAHAVDFEFAEVDAWRKARQILASGSLGMIRHVAITWRVETYSYRTNSHSWKTENAEGGGTLNNFASHTFYYLEWMFGAIRRLAAHLSGAGARAELWFEFEGGFPGSASIAADAFLGNGHRVEVYGGDGSLILENPTTDYMRGFMLRVATRKEGAFTSIPTEVEMQEGDGRIAPVSKIVRRILEPIESGGSASPNLEDRLRVQTLIDAARVSDRTGVWQSVARKE